MSQDEIVASQSLDNPTGCGRTLEIDLTWQWDHWPVEMLGNIDMLSNTTEEPSAFELVLGRQGHRPDIQQAYRDCRNISNLSFWEGVASAAYQKQWDRIGIVANLDWQWNNNRNSIVIAKQKYNSVHDYRRVLAMYWMMHGQRHNEGVMAGYRAAFCHDADWWWAKINSYF